MTAKVRSAGRGRYAFVIPRFSEGLAGGAETLIAQLARELARRGDTVELLTTCALDNRSWENVLPPGATIEAGLTVRRFPVDPRNLEIWIPHQVRISRGEALSIDEQLDWMTHGVNSTPLYAHLADHGESYDALFFGPYLFGTTFWGALINPERSYLIPCLHDEAYAYLGAMALLFRKVRGVLFNSTAEQELAQRLFGALAGAEVGMGFVPPSAADVSALSPYFAEKFPYLLYLGRKETGKNAQLLIDHFTYAKDRAIFQPAMRLVIAGGGSFSDILRPDAAKREDIVDLPHLSETDKRRVLRHALCLCQPSLNESFSIVLMEAWQVGVPVLVHGRCEVTRRHVVDSSGGLYFTGPLDFAAAVVRLYGDSELRRELADCGASYVRERYGWPAVLERFDTTMETIAQAADRAAIVKVEREEAPR